MRPISGNTDSKPSLSPLQAHIYNYLTPHFEGCSRKQIALLSINIAFLIRHKYGPDLDTANVAILYIGNPYDRTKKLTVLVHGGPGEFTAVIELVVNTSVKDVDAFMNLANEKVDAEIGKLLEKRGAREANEAQLLAKLNLASK